MPLQNISYGLIQVFDETELRHERCLDRPQVWGRVAHSFTDLAGVNVNGLTRFGTSSQAEIKPTYRRICPEYIAGSLIGDGHSLDLKCEENLPQGGILLTPVLRVKSVDGTVKKTTFADYQDQKLDKDGRVRLYNLDSLPGTNPELSYLIQFGGLVKFDPSLLFEFESGFPQMTKGQMPRFNLEVSRNITWPSQLLIGLIPYEDGVQVVKAEIYIHNVLGLAKGVFAGKPKVDLSFEVIAENSLRPEEDLSKLERELKGNPLDPLQKFPTVVKVGSQGDTPESLIRSYIEGELFTRSLREREAELNFERDSSEGTDCSIDLKFNSN